MFHLETRQHPFWLHDDLIRFFGNSHFPFEGRDFPAINIATSEEGATLSIEIPGVDPKDIDVSVTGNEVTIKGDRKAPEPQASLTYHRQERKFGLFERSVELPFEVDAGKVDASYHNGVLTVNLPRSEAERPKKISVKVA